jgi:hypothetical protein
VPLCLSGLVVIPCLTEPAPYSIRRNPVPFLPACTGVLPLHLSMNISGFAFMKDLFQQGRNRFLAGRPRITRLKGFFMTFMIGTPLSVLKSPSGQMFARPAPQPLCSHTEISDVGRALHRQPRPVQDVGIQLCCANSPGDWPLYAVSVPRIGSGAGLSPSFALRLPSDPASGRRPCLRLTLMLMISTTNWILVQGTFTP